MSWFVLTGIYQVMMIKIELSRRLGFYLLQIYLPSGLMVAMSWLSFWISSSASVERMALGVTLLLTLTTMFYGARSALPQVSYLTALDLWMTTCLVFVVTAVLEFTVVNVQFHQSENGESADVSSNESPAVSCTIVKGSCQVKTI